MQTVFLGESDGGRLVRLGGNALAQITTASIEAVCFDAETWDAIPLGSAGDCQFRMVLVTLQVSNGYAIRVTPKVDGVELDAHDFSGGGSGRVNLQAPISARGAACSVRVQSTARTGDLEVVDVAVAYFPLRAIP